MRRHFEGIVTESPPTGVTAVYSRFLEAPTTASCGRCHQKLLVRSKQECGDSVFSHLALVVDRDLPMVR
jgi:hypothetical protein